jgi:hypothetical protein
LLYRLSYRGTGIRQGGGYSSVASPCQVGISQSKLFPCDAWITSYLFRIDQKRKERPLHKPKVRIGHREIPLPASRIARIAIGSVLVLCGFLGFLPVLGFWMIPVGLLVLSVDVPVVRRLRRRITVWWARRRERRATSAP